MIGQRGFNLIELIVVMLTVSILLVLAVPSLRDMNEKNQLRDAIEKISSDLKIARSEAALRGTDVGFFHNSSGGSWCYGIHEISAAQPNCNCFTTNSCSIKTVPGSVFGSISFASNATGSAIDFQSIGTVDQQAVISLTTATSNYTASIKLNPIGKLTRCSTSVAGYRPNSECQP